MLSPVERFLIGYPGALCGIAFTGGILAEIDSRPVAWSGVLIVGAVVCSFLLDIRRRGPPPLEASGAPRGAVSRRLVVAVVFFVLGASRYRAALETRAVLFASPRGPLTILGTVIRPPIEGIRGANANAGADTSLEVLCHGWPRAVRVIAPTPLSGVRGGDVIRVTGTVSLPSGPRNPGESGAARSLTVRVQLRENVQLAPFDGHHYGRAVGQVRQHLYDVLSAIYTAPTRGYLLSILLGDRRLLAPRLRDALLYTGTYHFLAISGLHLGLVMLVVLRVPLPPKLRLSLRLLFLAAFAVLTGANPPVLRATLLFGLTLLSARGSRCPRPLNTLGWTALLILAWDPELIVEIGFQLTFVAVLALTVVHPRLWADSSEELLIRRQLRDVESRLSQTVAARRAARSRSWLSGALRWTLSLLAVSTTAFLGTSPLILHYFHRVHLLSPLWNLLAYPFTLATLLGGALSLGLGCIHPDLARPVASVVQVLVELMTDVLERAGYVPGSTLHLPAPGVPCVLICYVFLASWITLPNRTGWRLAVGLFLLAVASTAILLPHRAPTVWTFDDRHGGASLIALPNSEALLIDADSPGNSGRGAESIARAVLATGHGKLRALALPHPGRARACTVMTLRDRLSVNEVWISPQFQAYPAGRGTVDQLIANGVSWKIVARGSHLMVPSDDKTTIEAVYPHRGDGLLERARERDTSLVFRLTRSDRHVLFAGTLGDAGIARLISLEGEVRADVLLFPRGGPERRLWAELLREVDPHHVILVGRGGARDRKLARRIEKRGIVVLATWRTGAVVTEWVPGRGWVPRYWAE